MSITLAFWYLLFAVLSALTLTRPVWGIALYMQTFFAFPPLWWWGKSAAVDLRWSLLASLILAGSTAIHWRPRGTPGERSGLITTTYWLMAALLLNATIVNYAFSVELAISIEVWIQLLKMGALFFVMNLAVRDERDFKIVLLALIVGAGYIGFEATFNDRGRFIAGRLEGIGCPGAFDSNPLASVMVTILPLVGGYLFVGGKWSRWLSALAAPLVLNLVLLCNSRASLLAGIVAGIVLLALATGKVRKQALVGLLLGGCALLLLLRDVTIVERFKSTFVESSERDRSAQSRLEYWSQGIKFISHHPLGVGGNGFKKHYARVYLPNIIGERALHNGYLNEAAQWGVQGAILRLAFFAMAALCANAARKRFLAAGDARRSFLAVCVISGISAYLTSTLFCDLFDGEWGLWLCACSTILLRQSLQMQPATAVQRGFRPAWTAPGLQTARAQAG